MPEQCFQISKEANDQLNKNRQMKSWFKPKLERLYMTGDFQEAKFEFRPGHYLSKASGLRLIGMRDENKNYIVTILDKANKAEYNKYKDKEQIRTLHQNILSNGKYVQYSPDVIIKDDASLNKQKMPPSLESWLNSDSFVDSKSEKEDKRETIYESKNWIDEMSRLEGKHYYHIYELVERIVEEEFISAEGLLEAPPTQPESLSNVSGKTIFYCFSFDNTSSADGVILLSIAQNDDEHKIETARKKAKQIIDHWDSSSIVELQQCAHRCYPHYLLADDQAWTLVQENKEDNLSLTPEEQKLFDGMWKNPADHEDENGMPLFINGSAGSGKSTMLQWTFAKFCKCSINEGQHKGWHPIYLTWNEELLKKARAKVVSLLTFHADNLGDNENTKDQIARDWIQENLMLPFHQLLIDLIKRNKRDIWQEKFSNKDLFINLNSFKRLFNDRNVSKLPNGISLELSWHVIRVFIKGWRIQSNDKDLLSPLTPKEYKKFPEDDKTISFENYKRVYDEVWPTYERWCKEDGYWDQQDLVQCILDKKIKLSIDNQYDNAEDGGGVSAVFCDEAQDLTRLELEFVMSITSYDDYDLKQSTYFNRLPFVFAGDPQQTVQPTGFRWDAFKSAFYDKIVKPLTSHRPRALKINPNIVTLTHNLRSTEPIIKIGNSIQLLRKVLFNEGKIIPQRTWHKTVEEDYLAVPPLLFTLKRESDNKELIDYIQQTVIIIPCDIDGEEDYIKGDDLLRSILPGDKETQLNMVLSSAQAKGLEFSQVVLYGFGEKLTQRKYNIDSLIDKAISSTSNQLNHERLDMSESGSLELEYHLNKLYVAISRPTQKLFMLESEESTNLFWNKLFSNKNKLCQHQQNQEWSNLVADELNEGTQAYKSLLDTSHGTAAAEESAMELEKYAINGQDPKLFAMAAQRWNYCGAEGKERAKICRANELKYKGEYLEASKMFTKCDKEDDSRDCLWEGMHWQEFCNKSYEFSSYKYKLANLMRLSQDNKNRTAKIDFIEKVSAFILLEKVHISRESRQWVALSTLYKSEVSNICEGSLKLDCIEIDVDDKLTQDIRVKINDTIALLHDEDFDDFDFIYAKTLFLSGSDEDAVSLINNTPVLQEIFEGYRSRYHLARAQELNFNDAIDELLKIHPSDFEFLPQYIFNIWDRTDDRYQIDQAVLTPFIENPVVLEGLLRLCNQGNRLSDKLKFNLCMRKVSWIDVRACITAIATAKDGEADGEKICSHLDLIIQHARLRNDSAFNLHQVLVELTPNKLNLNHPVAEGWKLVLKKQLQECRIRVLSLISRLEEPQWKEEGSRYFQPKSLTFPWHDTVFKQLIAASLKDKSYVNNLHVFEIASLLGKQASSFGNKHLEIMRKVRTIYMNIISESVGPEKSIPLGIYDYNLQELHSKPIKISENIRSYARVRWYSISDHMLKLAVKSGKRHLEDAIEEEISSLFTSSEKKELSKYLKGFDESFESLNIHAPTLIEVKPMDHKRWEDKKIDDFLATKTPAFAEKMRKKHSRDDLLEFVLGN